MSCNRPELFNGLPHTLVRPDSLHHLQMVEVKLQAAPWMPNGINNPRSILLCWDQVVRHVMRV
eukprot:scaffold188596_cov30-Tisochrysis_lutea.AAC.2